MTTSSSTPTIETSRVNNTKQNRAHPWGYFFYCEFLKILRNPPAVVFGIGFPTLFFLIFANAFDAKYAPSMLAQYAAYGAFVVSFQTFSIAIASERSQGWNKLLRTTSMSATLYLGSKFLVIILTGIISLLTLFAVATITGRVHMDISVWARLFGFMLIGMVPFSLLGIFLGFVGSTNLAQTVSTVLSLILAFASGLFVPLQFLPTFVTTIAPYVPTYHLGQLAWYAVNASWSMDSHPYWFHLLILGAFAIVFLILAGWAYIRDENKNFA
ncbi:ABC transporter permease [Dictyobacter kobayashii]|uniref:ABC transporter n=1 Tax=Dictyobacter kobayashii TaxID=2014872 RepID=A0A402AHZ5_9CHLR|nr:ABC transporter permease [Dictyobacter kobayashii]GCE18727.1 ABC transporter [Dictyobacter kobayashii]